MNNKWTNIIKPKRNLFDVGFKEIYEFKDLLLLFVKRDFISIYKQTILGPLWFIIQPLLTTLMFTIVFGRIAGISTNGVPKILFYLAGLTFWNFFADSLNKTSNTFIQNQDVFGKVYFPRLISPLSVIVSNLLKFSIQFILFIGFLLYYIFFTDSPRVQPNIYMLLFPYLVIITGLLGLGLGLIITSLTTKYRDLKFLIMFGVQLWMYATPIIYPFSSLDDKMKSIIVFNPMTSIIETFKYGFIGTGSFSFNGLLYTTIFTLVVLFFSIIVFNKTEQNVMDTI